MTPTVLFLCTHNAGRSQMAMGFFQHLAGEQAVAWSGGSEPANSINPAAIEAMRERGIDIAMRIGPSTTPPASTSTACGRSATRSNDASADSSPNSQSLA